MESPIVKQAIADLEQMVQDSLIANDGAKWTDHFDPEKFKPFESEL
jgi:hypothetical protein